MELKLSSNFSGKPVSVVVPIEKVIEVFWPKDEKPPISLTVSTVLGADRANAEFSLGEETKESYPGIWLTTDNVKSHHPSRVLRESAFIQKSMLQRHSCR